MMWSFTPQQETRFCLLRPRCMIIEPLLRERYGNSCGHTSSPVQPGKAGFICLRLPLASFPYISRSGKRANVYAWPFCKPIVTLVSAIWLRINQDAAGWDAAHMSNSPFPPLNTLEQEIALNGLERVLLLLAYASMQKPGRPYDTRIQQIQELIANDLAAPHTLASLADAVALSSSRLGHLFRANTGHTVMQTLNAMRLHQAARLLETTPDSIEQIAARVGFQSAFYFSRVFHQAFGMSPRLYSQTHQTAH